MRTVILLRIGIFAIFALPFLLLNLSAIGTWGSMERAMSGLKGDYTSSGETTAPGFMVDLGGGINKLWGKHQEARTVNVMFNDDNFTEERVVRRTAFFTIDDVLAEGEEAPDQAFHQLWITARAPGIMMQHCDVILETFGRRCAFARQDVDRQKGGRYEVDTMLSFSPNYVSDLNLDSSGYTVETEHVRLPKDASLTRNIPIDQADDVIAELHKAAAVECEALRSAKGSCTISNLNIDRRDTEDRGTTTIKATARLAWLRAPDSTPDSATDSQDVSEDEDATNGLFTRFAALKEKASNVFGRGKTEKATVRNGGGAFQAAKGKVGSWLKAPGE